MLLYVGTSRQTRKGQIVETNETNKKPDNYRAYREQGFTESQAFRMNVQDVINWGIANGHIESKWGK
jgi:hypothetical protein